MKTTLSLLLIGLAIGSSFGAPQDYDRRVDAARIATDENRVYRGDLRRGDDWVASDLERLNREVRQIRIRIGDSRSIPRRLRDRFHRVQRSVEYLNDQFRRGTMRGGEIRRRADAIRVDLDSIRRDLRGRHIGLGGWR